MIWNVKNRLCQRQKGRQCPDQFSFARALHVCVCACIFRLLSFREFDRYFWPTISYNIRRVFFPRTPFLSNLIFDYFLFARPWRRWSGLSSLVFVLLNWDALALWFISHIHIVNYLKKKIGFDEKIKHTQHKLCTHCSHISYWSVTAKPLKKPQTNKWIKHLFNGLKRSLWRNSW